MIHTVKSFIVVNEAEVDVFLKFSCFFYDPMDVGNLVSGSSAFSKSDQLYDMQLRAHLLWTLHFCLQKAKFTYSIVNIYSQRQKNKSLQPKVLKVFKRK